MLMITVDAGPAVVTLWLVGRLGGPEASELARARKAVVLTQPHQTVLFDLTGLTGVDIVGKEFLAQAHRSGDRLVGSPSWVLEVEGTLGEEEVAEWTRVDSRHPGSTNSQRTEGES